MFRFLGQMVRRAWLPVLVAWGALLIVTRLLAPPWDEVAQDQEFGFLPANAASRRAEELFKQAFPNDSSSSNIVLVLHRGADQPPQLEADRKFIEDVIELELRRIANAEGGLADEFAPSEEPLFKDEAPVSSRAAVLIVALNSTPNIPSVRLAGQLDKRAMLLSS